MKCPKCGETIPDGHLYCEKCGMEISFVPEFDPEVENRINESLSGVASNLRDELFHTGTLPNSKKKGFDIRRHLYTIIAATGIVIGAIFASTAIISQLHSTGNYEDRAQDAYVKGDLEEAIQLVQMAISENDETDIEKRVALMFELYEYQKEAGQEEEAFNTMLELTDESVYDENTVLIAIDNVVNYYVSREEYSNIKDIVEKSGINAVKTKYAQYVPAEPKILPEEGVYEKILEIRMTCSAKGTIYYTVNGDEPDESSMVYEDEIVFEEDGDYVIKAVFVNSYGLSSDVVTKLYTLENTGPNEPEILEESGEYTQSTMIVAVCDTGCEIHYTTDGSNPTKNSQLYTKPINMPIGTTHYKFITVDAEGNVSDVVERNYHLSYSTLVSVEQARDSIIQILIELDVLLDYNGKMRSEEGYFDYVYDRDIEITGSGVYYVFVEKHVYNDGTTSDTGLLYAVNVHDGQVNRLGYDSSGNYTLINLSNG